MRLINAEDVEKDFLNNYIVDDCAHNRAMDECCQILNNTPEVENAVIVTFCENCENFDEWTDKLTGRVYSGCKMNDYNSRSKKDFCSKVIPKLNNWLMSDNYMACPNCRTTYEIDNWKFCPKCGWEKK